MHRNPEVLLSLAKPVTELVGATKAYNFPL